MKKSHRKLVPVLSVFLIMISFTVITESKSKKDPILKNTDLILVELFTSQGCSSCPPADDLLANTTKKKPNVIAISYHVDYWDRLGWKDPFSSEKATARQNDYRLFFKGSSLYTPQMIVNGQSEFVGSNESKLENAISSTTFQNNILITNSEINDGQILVKTTIKNQIKNTSLITVLVAKSAKTSIKRGENRGKNLVNTNVALAFDSSVAKQINNQISFKYPKEFSKENLQIISFLQNPLTKKIEAICVSNL